LARARYRVSNSGGLDVAADARGDRPEHVVGTEERRDDRAHRVLVAAFEGLGTVARTARARVALQCEEQFQTDLVQPFLSVDQRERDRMEVLGRDVTTPCGAPPRHTRQMPRFADSAALWLSCAVSTKSRIRGRSACSSRAAAPHSP
jgi:hypothetical protein